jgi:CheY-like chemotaxis protein
MSYNVLIVDDSKLARMSIARLLGNLRPAWGRIEAANANIAMARLSAGTTDGEKIHIALLDFNMPGRDGLALAADLHALRPDMPLAIISANSQDEIVARAKAIGAAFLPKPLTEQALADYLVTVEPRLRTAAG